MNIWVTKVRRSSLNSNRTNTGHKEELQVVAVWHVGPPINGSPVESDWSDWKCEKRTRPVRVGSGSLLQYHPVPTQTSEVSRNGLQGVLSGTMDVNVLEGGMRLGQMMLSYPTLCQPMKSLKSVELVWCNGGQNPERCDKFSCLYFLNTSHNWKWDFLLLSYTYIYIKKFHCCH